MVQENSSRPSGLPPSQGGKYVGFGSNPSPAAPQGHAGGQDVSAYLSKGFSQLSTAAGKDLRIPSNPGAEQIDKQH